MSLERNAIFARLTPRALSLKHIGAIGPINVTTAGFETFHAISELTVVCTRYSAMTATPLVIAINEPNPSRTSTTTLKISHILTFTPAMYYLVPHKMPIVL